MSMILLPLSLAVAIASQTETTDTATVTIIPAPAAATSTAGDFVKGEIANAGSIRLVPLKSFIGLRLGALIQDLTLYTTIAPKRITVSTSGIIPGIDALASLERRPNLAVSINAPDQKRRQEIMPITAKYPLPELMASLKRFPGAITAEYVLLAGYNDSQQDAVALARLLRGLHAKVNAIPFNADPNLPPWMKRPMDAAIDAFVDTLVRNGVAVTVRRSKGREIAAACGQLRGKEIATGRAARRVSR